MNTFFRIRNIIYKLFDRAIYDLSKVVDFGYDRNSKNFNNNQKIVKLKKLAVFTRTYNEGDVLLLWERYWAKEVGYENLFVINNGGTDESCGKLNSATSVINLPLTDVSHQNWATIDGYFQRLLLQRYEWVIKTDTDEILCCEENIESYLASQQIGIYCPEHVVHVVHDYKKESPIRYNEPISTQRSLFVEEIPEFRRPTITSKPASWSPGNHQTYERNFILKGIWAFHLHCLDFDQLNNRHKRWLGMSFSKDDYDNISGLSNYKSRDLNEVHNITEEEFAVYFGRNRVSLPLSIIKKLSF